MSRVGRLFSAIALQPIANQLNRALAAPREFQLKVLRNLIHSARDTEFGRDHHFSEILRSGDVLTAYQSAVPLRTFDELYPYIERVRNQQSNVLWPGRTRHFALSSGTTSTSKELPVTADLFRHFRRFARQLVAAHLLSSRTISPLCGMALALTGGVQSDPKFPGVRVGQISGLVAENSSASWTAPFRRNTIPKSIDEIEDVDQKIEQLARFVVGRDVRMMVMMPRLVVRLMDAVLRIKQSEQPSATLADIWPNLQLVIGGGQPMSEYRHSIQERFGEKPLSFLEMYGASESMFALALPQFQNELVLHPDNRVFFEFVRYSQLGSDRMERLAVGDLQPGVEYGVYVSTCGGLWSYNMQDVILVTGVNPLRLKVIGRCNEILSACGLAITGFELRRAMAEAAESCQVFPMAFHVSVDSRNSGIPWLRWLVEFDRAIPNLDEFVRTIDTALRQINTDYRQAQKASRFGPATVVSLPEGAFNSWIKLSQGILHAQAKVPILSNSPEFANGVIRQIKI